MGPLRSSLGNWPHSRALSDGRLLRGADGTLLVREGSAVAEAATGVAVTPAAEPARITINNRVRVALRGALGRLQLATVRGLYACFMWRSGPGVRVVAAGGWCVAVAVTGHGHARHDQDADGGAALLRAGTCQGSFHPRCCCLVFYFLFFHVADHVAGAIARYVFPFGEALFVQSIIWHRLLPCLRMCPLPASLFPSRLHVGSVHPPPVWCRAVARAIRGPRRAARVHCVRITPPISPPPAQVLQY